MTQPPGQPRIPLSRLQLPHPMSLHVFEKYEQAQRAVDYLSDREFPVQNVMIVGTDLKQVERVTGRLTAGRVLASGAASGAWMGAFFGLLMWAFVQGGGGPLFLTAVLVGGLFGMIWALILYRFTGGARDFTSVMQVVATRYELLVEATLIAQARALLEDQRRGVPNDAGREPQSRVAGGSAPAQGQGFSGPYGAPGGTPGMGSAPPAPPAVSAGATAHSPYGASAHPPYGPAQPAPTPPEPPKYRTYGEALDAERAARTPRGQGADEAAPVVSGPGGATPGTGDATRSTGGATPGAAAGDDSAAEDAHDAPAADSEREPR